MPDPLNTPTESYPFEFEPNSLLEGSTSDFNLAAGSVDVNLMNCKGCSSINAKSFTMFGRNDSHIIGNSVNHYNDRQQSGETIWQFNDYNELSSAPASLTEFGSYFYIYGKTFLEIDINIGNHKYLNFTFMYLNESIMNSDASVTFYGISDPALGASDIIEEIVKFKIPGRLEVSDLSFKLFSKCFGSKYQFIRVKIESSSFSVSEDGLYIYKESDRPIKLTYLNDNVNPVLSRFNSRGEEGSYYISDESCFFIADSGVFIKGADVNAFSSSDIRLKKNVKDLSLGMEDIKRIKPVIFKWNKNQKTYKGLDIGFLAQDVQGVLSELVVSRNDGFKAIDYKKSVIIGVQGVKEINKTIQRIRSKIKNGK